MFVKGCFFFVNGVRRPFRHRANVEIQLLSVKRLLIGGLILAALAGPAQAGPTRYVGDTLVITLRAGKGDEYKILKTLPSGTAMEVLEEDGPYARVRLEGGMEGWVRKQYLIDTPIARDLLAQARQRLERLELDNRRMEAELASLTARNEELAQQRHHLEQENLRLSQENAKLQDLAARPLELDEENRRLRAENERLGAEMARVDAENTELRNSTVQKWFMAGGGVLIAGIVLGFVLPRVGRRRRSSW